MKILTVVGNRPQFIKAAAVSGPLREVHEELLVHTGQHHDDSLSAVFFRELGLPRPDRELGIAGGSNTSQLARQLARAGAAAGSRAPRRRAGLRRHQLHACRRARRFDAGVPVAHVEAGMRSFDRTMPEERNRVVVDHLSELLLCASETAAENLRAESVAGRVEVVGDVMVDLALRMAPAARADTRALEAHGVRAGAYLLLTAHRAGNVDPPERLRALVELVRALPGPVVFPLHPRTRARLRGAGLLEELAATEGLRLTEPLGYGALAALMCHARAVLTDSGGVQKEAYLAGVPCVTLRASTEWVETVQAGWNTLVDLDTAAALAALERWPKRGCEPEASVSRLRSPTERPPLYGDGHAAERCVQAIGTLAA